MSSSLDRPPICGLNPDLVGPFTQQLFLGCSVVDFTTNLGWGGENSSCSVQLVEDTSQHPQSATIRNQFFNQLQEIENRNLTNAVSASPRQSNIGAFEGGGNQRREREDTNKQAHITLIKDINEKEKDRQRTNTEATSPWVKDLGKVYWNNINNSINYWIDQDPGFLGKVKSTDNKPGRTTRLSLPNIENGIDLAGVPVLFRYGQNFSFGGIIKSWKESLTPEGGSKYTVDISSFSELLNQTQLIIGHYAGSVFNIVPNTSNNVTNRNLGFPEFVLGRSSIDINGTIAQGNTPNIFNIYGYLESFGFGNAKENENGIPAYLIYDAMTILLNPGRDSRNNNSDILLANVYSPYGGIMCKSVAYIRGTGSNQQYVVPDTNTTLFNSSLGGAPLTWENLGLLPTVVASDQQRRSVFRLDISEVPRPPVGLRLKGPTLTIMQFITDLCEGAGVNFFVEFIPNFFNTSNPTSRFFSGTIKIRTVNRRIQPPKNLIKNLLDTFDAVGTPIKTKEYGQEYNEGSTRTMIVGGKQKRLVQYRSTRFNWRQSTFIYAANGFIPIPLFGNHNFVRFPLFYSYRSQTFQSGGAAVADSNVPFRNVNDTSSILNFSTGVGSQSVVFGTDNILRRGNYDNPITLTTTPPGIGHSIPLHHDVICPYFGKHFDGSVRQVYYDRGMGQLQIVFKISDLFVAGNTLPIGSEPNANIRYFMVLENEIRAAGAGFEQWLSYCFDNGFYTDIERLVYRAIARRRSADPTSPTRPSVFNVASIMYATVMSLVNPSHYRHSFLDQFGVSNLSAYGDILPSLRAIHAVFVNIANEYYGKAFMVSLPAIRSYTDLTVTNIIVGRDFNNNPIYAIEGTPKRRQDYEISKDGAWEEPGNIIDNTIMIGGVDSQFFTNENNLIQPIVGYDTSSPHVNSSLGADSVLVLPRLNPVGQTSYVKSSVEENIEFLNQGNQVFPKAIVKVPSPVFLTSNIGESVRAVGLDSNSLKRNMLHDSFIALATWMGQLVNNEDAQQTIRTPQIVKAVGGNQISALPFTFFSAFSFESRVNVLGLAKAHETALGGLKPKLFFGGANNPLSDRLVAMDNMRALELSFMIGNLPRTTFELTNFVSQAYDNAAILPKALLPNFVALPIQHNQYVYGPWVNMPGLIARNIFSEFNNNAQSAQQRVENLVGGVKVEVEPTLVPWEYGSMTALDQAVMLRLNGDANYQQELEIATLEIPKFPDLRLGYVLENIGAILNSLSVRIGTEGVTTNLTFRTYTRKLGFYNKESADRLKSIQLENIRRNKEIVAAYNDLRQRIVTSSVGSSTNLGDFANQTIPKVLRWSPVEILVGASRLAATRNVTVDYQNDLKYSPTWHIAPINRRGSFGSDGIDSLKQISRVTLQDFREAPLEMQNHFDKKSIMSLDGILSPVSLYPTLFGATNHITKYDTRTCPLCKGTKSYRWNFLNNSINNAPVGRGNGKIPLNETISPPLICDFCENKSLLTPMSSYAEEIEPPYILTSGSDTITLSQFENIRTPNIINYSTYNPIVLNSGEFSNTGNKQPGDDCAHSIDVVSFGYEPDPTYGQGLRSVSSYDPSTAFNPMVVTSTGTFANNHRFFALKGPLILHSWGYDLEGYPVPNKADEPRITAGGDYIRDRNNNIVKQGQNPLPNNNWSSGLIRSREFYKGWTQLQSTWPVGPIDLRWDRDAQVWTIGANYRPVFVVLEEDLVNNQPVRGFLLRNNIDNDPIPPNLRKLIFVKDNKGITAPRNSLVYCRYNNKNGFYEPVYANNNIALGTLKSSSVVEFDSSAFVFGNTPISDRVTTYTTRFENPLNFVTRTNAKGIFVFIQGKWILQSTN